MWLRCLGFALLVWIPGLLHAQGAHPCSAPDLNKGYFHPVQDSYSHNTIIYYGCDKEYKPVVEGWWATSRCLNGKWTHKPQCIDEDSCFAPNIDNAMPVEGLYTAGQTLPIQCKSGYEHESRDKTAAECMNGQWTKVPVCRKRTGACEAPPQYANAVIINHKYQEVFDENKELRYQCRDGYVGENGAQTAVKCKGERWEGRPNCKRSSSPTPTDRNNQPAITTIDKCGQLPVVKDGVNSPDGTRSLRFKCAKYYRLEGPEQVKCYSDGTWSDLPTCRANYCSVNTAQYADLKTAGVAYITNGETKRLECVDKFMLQNYALVACEEGTPKISRCCNKLQINTSTCWIRGKMTD